MQKQKSLTGKTVFLAGDPNYSGPIKKLLAAEGVVVHEPTITTVSEMLKYTNIPALHEEIAQLKPDAVLVFHPGIMVDDALPFEERPLMKLAKDISAPLLVVEQLEKKEVGQVHLQQMRDAGIHYVPSTGAFGPAILAELKTMLSGKSAGHGSVGGL